MKKITPPDSEGNLAGPSRSIHPSPPPSSSQQNVADVTLPDTEGEGASIRRDDFNVEEEPTIGFMGEDEEEEVKHPTVKLLEHASYLFDKDRIEVVRRAMNLLPRGREFVVFNVFGDLARALGYGRRRRKHVDFPKEILDEYQIKGDVAGKDRFVPSAKQPYRGVSATTKKRKLSAVYTSWTVKASDFVPRVDRIDDYSKLEYCCERNCIGCECCCDCCKSSKKPNLAIVMEGFCSDLNLASFFLHSHATRTFESAMGALEFVQLHTFSWTTIAPKMRNMAYHSKKFGMITSSIWIFGYCIRTILEMAGDNNEPSNITKLPSEAGFRKLMESFAATCLTINDSIKIILQYSYNFYNFGKECIRILKVLQIHSGFKAEFSLKKPLKRGDGLELNRDLKNKAVVKQRAVKVMVAKSKSADEDDDKQEWKLFEDISGNEKVHCLRQLLNVSMDGIGLVQTQLRFLLDDIVDSVKDIAEADLLFLLADMYDRIKYLGNVGKKFTKVEREQISSLMTDFCKDFQSFLEYGQHIIKRYVEFRDIVHLTHTYLVTGLNLEALAEMLPADIFRKKKRPWCCGGGQAKKPKKGVVHKYYPKYKVMDFFKVHYREAVHPQIYANKYTFCLGWSMNAITDIVPRHIQCRWGDTESDAEARGSYEEYVDPDEIDEEPVTVEVIKPILIASVSPSSDDHVVETLASPTTTTPIEGEPATKAPVDIPSPNTASAPNTTANSNPNSSPNPADTPNNTPKNSNPNPKKTSK